MKWRSAIQIAVQAAEMQVTNKLVNGVIIDG